LLIIHGQKNLKDELAQIKKENSTPDDEMLNQHNHDNQDEE
jgi:hypothetical protein